MNINAILNKTWNMLRCSYRIINRYRFVLILDWNILHFHSFTIYFRNFLFLPFTGPLSFGNFRENSSVDVLCLGFIKLLQSVGVMCQGNEMLNWDSTHMLGKGFSVVIIQYYRLTLAWKGKKTYIRCVTCMITHKATW